MKLIPHVSEKSYARLIAEAMPKAYIFRVPRGSRKEDIAAAVAEQYSVEVSTVNTINLPNKPVSRRFKGRGEVPGRCKAVVTLRAGQSIQAYEDAVAGGAEAVEKGA